MSKVAISARLYLLVMLFPTAIAFAQGLSERESALVRSIDDEGPAAVALLERIVNINSGTFNTAGVLEVGKALEKEFQTLGFATRWVPMDSVKRAPSLVAEHKGTRGKRVLLIGHMDTVFEPSSPFQKFVRTGETATGPGTSDMKGGIVVMLSALKALKSAGALDGAAITVFLTGDEESAGEPIEVGQKKRLRSLLRTAAEQGRQGLCNDGAARQHQLGHSGSSELGALQPDLLRGNGRRRYLRA
jgi:glutamate carboxypeptidase